MTYTDYFKFDNNILQIKCNAEKVLSIKYCTSYDLEVKKNYLTEDVIKQLCEFMNAQRTSFQLPLDVSHLTNFQQDVLITLKDNVDKCITYKELANISGHPNASRAVGTVMKNNPYAIVIPCHLVVSSTNTRNYSGASIDTKEKLIKLSEKKT